MRREIFVLLLLVAAIGCVAFMISPGRHLDAVVATLSDGTAIDREDTLVTATDYNFSVAPTTQLAQGDSVSWLLTKSDGTPVRYELNDNDLEASFTEPGSYVLRGLLAAREIARDTFLVALGERFQVDWPEITRDTVGGSFAFADLSTGVKSVVWEVRLNDSVVARSEEDSWTWTPADTGIYNAHVDVTLNSEAVESSDILLTVEPPPPPVEAVVEEPVVVYDPAPVRPEREKAPAPPPPEPEAPTIGDCFSNSVLSTFSTINLAQPTRQDAAFKTGATSFVLSPSVDCQLTGFNYFGNSNSNKVVVTVECLTDDCNGQRSRTTTGRAANDAYVAYTMKVSRLPVMSAGKQYKITIATKDGSELGFFVVPPTATTEVGDLRFEGVESCVFDLKFKR